MKSPKIIVIAWIMIMFLVTFTCSLTYLVTQQNLRLGANERPMQKAVDTKLKLQSGTDAAKAVPSNTINISKSLTTFVMVYDSNKKLIASSGVMNGKKPSYPKGVLDYTNKNSMDKVTWQPKSGLRFATVAIKTQNGFVVAGRSLQQTESLINQLGKLIFYAWIACFICSALAGAAIIGFLMRIDNLRMKRE